MGEINFISDDANNSSTPRNSKRDIPLWYIAKSGYINFKLSQRAIVIYLSRGAASRTREAGKQEESSEENKEVTATKAKRP